MKAMREAMEAMGMPRLSQPRKTSSSLSAGMRKAEIDRVKTEERWTGFSVSAPDCATQMPTATTTMNISSASIAPRKSGSFFRPANKFSTGPGSRGRS
jgi:hypothetical protein